jgi:hypothetical protein
MLTEEVFAEFITTCRDNFDSLMAEHGLSLSDAEQCGHECVVVYKSASQRVVINFEFLSAPWVVLERKSANRWKRKGLHQAFAKVRPREIAVQKQLKETIQGLYDFSRIALLSSILRQHWKDLFAAI